jgi:hypothetical protein
MGRPTPRVILMSAPAAGIAPSRLIAAEISTARSVRSLLGNAGSPRVAVNCSRPAICTWSSHSPADWRHWFCRTRKFSTISCSAPVPKPFSKWPAIRNISAQRLVSSVCYTRGVRSSKFIRTAVLLRRRPVLLSITIDDPGGWGKEIGP